MTDSFLFDLTVTEGVLGLIVAICAFKFWTRALAAEEDFAEECKESEYQRNRANRAEQECAAMSAEARAWKAECDVSLAERASLWSKFMHARRRVSYIEKLLASKADA